MLLIAGKLFPYQLISNWKLSAQLSFGSILLISSLSAMHAQVCDDVQDCPQTETSDGGEDEEDCDEGEQS